MAGKSQHQPGYQDPKSDISGQQQGVGSVSSSLQPHPAYPNSAPPPYSTVTSGWCATPAQGSCQQTSGGGCNESEYLNRGGGGDAYSTAVMGTAGNACEGQYQQQYMVYGSYPYPPPQFSTNTVNGAAFNNSASDTSVLVSVRERKRDYLVSAIMVTLCCFLPTGIPAIVFASEARSAYDAGNYDAGDRNSRLAKMFTAITICIGIAIITICSITYMLSFILIGI